VEGEGKKGALLGDREGSGVLGYKTDSGVCRVCRVWRKRESGGAEKSQEEKEREDRGRMGIGRRK
jgi:hypothetical protein